MERETTSLLAAIFRDAFPELDKQLKRLLPEHKLRYRNVLIEILRRGCLAAKVSPATAPAAKKGKRPRKEVVA